MKPYTDMALPYGDNTQTQQFIESMNCTVVHISASAMPTCHALMIGVSVMWKYLRGTRKLRSKWYPVKFVARQSCAKED